MQHVVLLLLALIAVVLCEYRVIHLIISNTTLAPNTLDGSTMFGQPRSVLAINGTVPGPLLVWTYGDMIEIHVSNELSEENTTIHWHGIDLTGSSCDMDGVDGITQCGIPPGRTRIYKFAVLQAGSFWYHSHTGMQYTEGVLGPIIVHHNPHIKEDPYADLYSEEAYLVLQDWHHQYTDVLLSQYLSTSFHPGTDPNPNSILINGYGRCVESAGCGYADRYNLTLDGTSSYKLHIVNAGTYSFMNFSIDGHWLDVVNADGVDVELFSVRVITINIGQRYGFILRPDTQTDTTEKNFWIRANVDTDFLSDETPYFLKDTNPLALAVLRYPNAPLTDPTTQSSTEPLLEETQLSPVDAEKAYPESGEQVENVLLQFKTELDGSVRAYFNKYTFNNSADGRPILQQILESTERTPNNPSVILETGEYITIYLRSYGFTDHPVHLHGHDLQIIGKTQDPEKYPAPARGTYCNKGVVDKLWLDPSNPATQLSDPNNPIRRDSTTVPPCGLVVFKFKTTGNPGAWFFHCHVGWHLEGGLALVFIEQPHAIAPVRTPFCESNTYITNPSTYQALYALSYERDVQIAAALSALIGASTVAFIGAVVYFVNAKFRQSSGSQSARPTTNNNNNNNNNTTTAKKVATAKSTTTPASEGSIVRRKGQDESFGVELSESVLSLAEQKKEQKKEQKRKKKLKHSDDEFLLGQEDNIID